MRRLGLLVTVAVLVGGCGSTEAATGPTGTPVLSLQSGQVAPTTALASGTLPSAPTEPATVATTVAPTTTTTTPGVGAGLQASDQTGDTVKVTLVKVEDPAVAALDSLPVDAGKRLVGVEVTIADAGSSTVNDDANNDVSVVGSDNQTYTAAFDGIAGCTNFNNGEYTLAAGQTTTGCVTFQLPAAVTVAMVEFALGGGFGGTTAEWNA